MLRATLRSLLSHKLRLALSGLAIVLGVSFVTGTLIFTDTLSRTFNNLFASTTSDVTVTPARAFDTGLAGSGGVAALVPEGVVDQVAGVDGVAAAEGSVQAEGVYLLLADGTVLDTGGAPGIGISWTEDERLSPTTLTEGRAPARAGEVAIDTGAAENGGFAVGDQVVVLTTGPRVEAELVGLFRFGESGGLAGASLTAFDTATAQELLAEPGAFSEVAVATREGVSPEELRDRVAAAVGPDYDVATGEETAAELAGALEQGLSFINIFLLSFAGIALFVGTFLILNTFSMLVAQRTRELALLRALGASRRQVTLSVLGEALVLGLLGATAGLAGGFAIATGLRAVFGSFGLTLDGALVLEASTVAWAYVVGVLVTLLAAYLPARRASRTAPIAAMRDDPAVPEHSLRRRTAAGGVLVLLGVGLLAAAETTDDGGDGASLVGLGAVALLVGAIALSPVLAAPFVRAVGAVLPRLFGSTGRLARENALRNPRRTAATASALMIGLALVSAFSVIGSSASASVDQLINRALGADYVVSTAVGQPFTAAVADGVREVDGVDAVMQERFGTGQFDGSTQFFTALDAETLDRTLTLDYLEGDTAGLASGGLIAAEPLAQEQGWAIGDEIELLLPNGERRTLELGGVHRVNQAVGSVSVSLETYRAAGGPELDNFVYVRLADGADPDRVRTELEQVVADYPVVSLKDQSEFAAEQTGQVDQLLLLINALLVLSVLIAVLGIVNTLALSVIERTREIGLLRAIGMSRRQLRRMVRLESVVLAVYGATLGLVLGTVLGAALTRALAAQGIEVLVVPWPRLALFFVLAAVVGVLAAVWPARRAARLQVLDAIAS